MYIKGIGRVSKTDLVSILSAEGRQSFEDGTITMDEVVAMYKMQRIKALSRIGSFPDLFFANYAWIPDGLKDALSPADLAALVDAFYSCYSSKKDG